MSRTEPIAELDARFSSENATATAWADASTSLEKAEVSWLSTVRPDGRPHVTPILFIWQAGLYFCTGPSERKADNLSQNAHCVVTTGCNALNEGLDVVVEGEAVRLTDEEKLRAVAVAYESKYGSEWHFDVRDGSFHGEGGEALVFEIAPSKAFGFARGVYSQTRWTFDGATG